MGSSFFDMLDLNLAGHPLGQLSRKPEDRKSGKNQDFRPGFQSHPHLTKRHGKPSNTQDSYLKHVVQRPYLLGLLLAASNGKIN